jgi:hypothetical protein
MIEIFIAFKNGHHVNFEVDVSWEYIKTRLNTPAVKFLILGDYITNIKEIVSIHLEENSDQYSDSNNETTIRSKTPDSDYQI